MADKTYGVIEILPDCTRKPVRNCTIYDRPYRGDGFGTGFVVLKTRLTSKYLYCWLVKPDDKRLKQIPYLGIDVEWNGDGVRHRLFLSPNKYVEGKRCESGRGGYFTMGPISERLTAYDVWKRRGVLTSEFSPACRI